jgi:hypothetical protein
MQANEKSLFDKIKMEFDLAEKLMLDGKLEESFQISEEIAQTIALLNVENASNQELISLHKKFARFRRNLNNKMVKVVKSGINIHLPDMELGDNEQNNRSPNGEY